MKLNDIGVITLGPGSQPEEADGQALNYLHMPKDMHIYTPPSLPQPEALYAQSAAYNWLVQLQRTVTDFRVSQAPISISLHGLDAAEQQLLDQVLGDGEVSVIKQATATSPNTLRIQESVFAGVWRVQASTPQGELSHDCVEVGVVPSCVDAEAFRDAAPEPKIANAVPDGVVNAPAVLSELLDKARDYQTTAYSTTINLTLLPHSPEDLTYLEQQLGLGPITILSRGYGNCRITSTALRNVWWVQYYNSTDVLILNSLEVTAVPLAACASQDDLCDSAERLAEILDNLIS